MTGRRHLSDVHLIHIGICTGQIRIECTLIVFILHFELRRITTLPHDLRGMKQVPTDAIVVLALVKLRPAVTETSK